jgi:hypothetical protein
MPQFFFADCISVRLDVFEPYLGSNYNESQVGMILFCLPAGQKSPEGVFPEYTATW